MSVIGVPVTPRSLSKFYRNREPFSGSLFLFGGFLPFMLKERDRRDEDESDEESKSFENDTICR